MNQIECCDVVIGSVVWNQTNFQVQDLVNYQLWIQVEHQVQHQVWNQIDRNLVWNQVESQVYGQVWKHVWNQVWNNLQVDQVEFHVRDQFDQFTQVDNQTGNQVLR